MSVWVALLVSLMPSLLLIEVGTWAMALLYGIAVSHKDLGSE